MRAGLFAAFVLVFMVSCSAFPAPMAPTPFPTLTPVVLASPPAPTPGPVEILLQPTASPVIFRDDFNLVLKSGWDWRGPSPADLDLSEQRGSVRLSAGPAYVSAGGKAALLLRLAPEGDFRVETRIVFLPTEERQFAGIVIYESGNAYLQAGRSYCRKSPACVRDGLYFDRFTDARLQDGGLHVAYTGGDTVFLRLERRGTTYTLYASRDNVIWQPLGVRQSEIDPLYIGLFAGQNPAPVIPAYFDYFQVSSLPPAP